MSSTVKKNSPFRPARIRIVTLGCAKNLVDSEVLSGNLRREGLDVIHDDDPLPADIVIINTCGFIHDARVESIDTILHYAALKTQGKIRELAIMGCLSGRYPDDLAREIPEADAIFGVDDLRAILGRFTGHPVAPDPLSRKLITPPHYAYLKVSEGCNRRCSFCAIPLIRGPQRSRSEEEILEEASMLVSAGAREIILVAQDLTSYGMELYGQRRLVHLVDRLSASADIPWLRLQYLYPGGIPPELIDLMRERENICNYIDLPLQHISNEILKSMLRGHTRAGIERLLVEIREKLPRAAIRTTLIVGYPGESALHFRELLQFIRETRFDRLGVFQYSHEEQTAAFRLDDHVPRSVKKQRADRIMKIQQEIALQKNISFIGKTLKVIVDRMETPGLYSGRTEYDSPEVDNEVIISAKDGGLMPGMFCDVRITGAEAFELFGEPVTEKSSG
ncbi:MAG: 30S ribosomal protein S12 methylthiotransferase RimO [Bacteroidales bacterium]|nr:30S ribosomal protein S12 methylthiotransferase RimO [Bacteroidales bacterium]